MPWKGVLGPLRVCSWVCCFLGFYASGLILAESRVAFLSITSPSPLSASKLVFFLYFYQHGMIDSKLCIQVIRIACVRVLETLMWGLCWEGCVFV